MARGGGRGRVPPLDASELQIAYGLAAPVAIVLLTTWVVHLPFSRLGTVRASVLLPAATAVLLISLAVELVGLPTVVAGIAGIAGIVVAVFMISTVTTRGAAT